jgi:hypothetical protein
MGDRSNVFIQQGEKDGKAYGVGIYSHWHGTTLHDVALEALPKAAGRVGDPSYFARIVIHNILARIADADSATGFGIYSDAHGAPDNGYDILVIDANTGRYWLTGEGGYLTPESVAP